MPSSRVELIVRQSPSLTCVQTASADSVASRSLAWLQSLAAPIGQSALSQRHSRSSRVAWVRKPQLGNRSGSTLMPVHALTRAQSVIPVAASSVQLLPVIVAVAPPALCAWVALAPALPAPVVSMPTQPATQPRSRTDLIARSFEHILTSRDLGRLPQQRIACSNIASCQLPPPEHGGFGTIAPLPYRVVRSRQRRTHTRS